MKTKFLHIATALLFAGFTSSCSDFLDRYPLDELSDSSFWKTENDAMMAVTDIYGCLPTWDQDEDIIQIMQFMALNGLPVTYQKVFTIRWTKAGRVVILRFVNVTWYWKK